MVRVPALLVLALCGMLASTAGGETRPPNVILVSIDTLRADHLSSYGYAIETAPFIRSLGERGLLFENAIVPLPATTPSHASMLTSLTPPQHGSVSLTSPMSRSVDTLAAALKRQGYATGGFVAVSHIGRAFNFDAGFDAFTQPSDAQRDGESVNRDAIAWLEKTRRESPAKPVFLFVHYFDTHAPYGWWKDPKNIPGPSTEIPPREDLIARYDESIRHVDSLLERLHRALGALGVLDDAVLCVTSDHGEQIGDHGLPSGHADIYRETVRVPLIITGKGLPSLRMPHLVSTMDIAVSILRWTGGRFRHTPAGRVILPDRASVVDRAKYWLTGGGGDEDRALLVTGNPLYTRSILLVQGNHWFIKNLEAIYQHVTTAPAEGQPIPALKEVPRVDTSEDGNRYTIPATSYSPFIITVDFRPRSECQGLSVSLAPQLAYFSAEKHADPVRLQFGAARLDLVTITVKPRTCAGRLLYRIDRPGSHPLLAGGVKRQTELFQLVYAARKRTRIDELFDASTDPEMTSNLAEIRALEPVRRAMERKLRELYQFTYGRGTRSDSRRVSREELEKLKSLGYLF